MATRHKNGKDGKRRGNHTGTLIKRGNTYLAQWSVRGPDGKRKRISKSTHCKNIEDARAFLENELKNLTLDDEEKFVDRLLDAKKLIQCRAAGDRRAESPRGGRQASPRNRQRL